MNESIRRSPFFKKIFQNISVYLPGMNDKGDGIVAMVCMKVGCECDWCSRCADSAYMGNCIYCKGGIQRGETIFETETGYLHEECLIPYCKDRFSKKILK